MVRFCCCLVFICRFHKRVPKDGLCVAVKKRQRVAGMRITVSSVFATRSSTLFFFFNVCLTMGVSNVF